MTSYSGFLTVDERYNSNLFFWYFPKPNQKEPKNVGNSTTPWIIWLQGGPGATSLVGLFSEMGPFEYIDNQLKCTCKYFIIKYFTLSCIGCDDDEQ